MMAALAGAAGKTWPPRAIYFGEASGSRILPGIYFFTFIFFQYTLHLECRSPEPFVLYDCLMCKMYSHGIKSLYSI